MTLDGYVLRRAGVMDVRLGDELGSRRLGSFVCWRRGRCTGHSMIRGRRFWGEEYLLVSIFE